jgi:formate hydrogenlyase subunit 3/multisubunit Na+/H+ antiporter MnhD subunit
MNHLVLLIALPLLAAFLLPIVKRVSITLGNGLGPTVLLLTSGIGLSVWPQMAAGPQAIAIGGFMPPLGIVLYVDKVSLLFALAMHIGSLLLWADWKQAANTTRRQVLALVMAAAGSGMVLSGDLFNIYVFYELLAVASYGLVIRTGVAASYAAAIRYLIINAFGAALILIGIALVYNATGTLNLAQLAQMAPRQLDGVQGTAAFIFMLVGFGVKAELFAVNTWVPEVYATASRRITALLAGVVSKLALLVILRLLVLLFPHAETYQLLLILGVLGVVTGELAAWRSRDLARMLAYSSIGQLGIVFIAFSIPGEAGIVAGLAVALHHLLVKPALFLLAQRWGGSITGLAGAAATSPVAAGIFVLLAMSLIGVPPLPGFWAKLLVLMPLLGQGTSLQLLAVLVMLAAVVLEAGYLFRVVRHLYRSRDDEPPAKLASHALVDVATAGLLAVVLLAGVLLLPRVSTELHHMAMQIDNVELYIKTVSPLALGNGEAI